MITGWDDAPLVSIEMGTMLKQITIIYPYYENPFSLSKRVYHWGRLPRELRQNMSAIVVDDGSPEHPASNVFQHCSRPFPIRLFRIDVDRRWNWLAARNIGMHYAQEGWCIATDMDHIIPEETLSSLIMGNHREDHIYRFSRVENTGVTIHSHPNSWFMTRKTFWKFGGYDEALSGYYGTDGEARRRWVKTAPVLTLKDHLIRDEYNVDSSTTKYKRKEAIDMTAQRIIKSRGKDWKPKVLSFPYHEVTLP